MAEPTLDGTRTLAQGVRVVYVDENSINRALAALILNESGSSCTALPTVRAMMDAIAKERFDVAVLDYGTATADPDGLAMAKRDPRFRDLPLVAVGADDAKACLVGASAFAAAPLDPGSFLAAVHGALRGLGASGKAEAIGRAALLARVSGRPEAAERLLSRFVEDYAGYDALIQEAAKSGEKHKVEFLLRNLRAAASAVGANDLFRSAAEAQEHEDRTKDAALLGSALRAALAEAVAFRSDLRRGRNAGPLDAAKANRPVEGLPQPSPDTLRPLILAVDDSTANRKLLESVLEDEYRVSLAADGYEALATARSGTPPALILLDVTMPGIDGYETCRLLKEDPRTRSIPVVFLTSLALESDEEKGLALGAVDYVRKPFSIPVLKARVRSHLDLQRYRSYLEAVVDERTRELQETQREVVYRLARAAEFRDNDTGDHIKRIGHYALLLAERLGFPRSQADALYFASSMHDVGKIGIPDAILLKPGALSDEEWLVMRRHTTIGAGLLEGHPSELLHMAARIALTHHEKWNGKGYPSGLAGEAIPMEGRVVSICDVFDALMSARPYKRAWTYEETLDEINKLSGTHFDPSVVKCFNGAFPEMVRIRERFAD